MRTRGGIILYLWANLMIILTRILRWLTALLLLPGLTACTKDKDDPQLPQSLNGVVNRAISVEIWTDSREYHFSQTGQDVPVHIRVTLTNVTGRSPDYLPTQTLILHSESQSKPVVDIIVESGTSGRPLELVWSQENPDAAVDTLTLSPGESYTVEWMVSLPWPHNTDYGVFVDWINIYGRVSRWGLPIAVREP